MQIDEASVIKEAMILLGVIDSREVLSVRDMDIGTAAIRKLVTPASVADALREPLNVGTAGRPQYYAAINSAGANYLKCAELAKGTANVSPKAGPSRAEGTQVLDEVKYDLFRRALEGYISHGHGAGAVGMAASAMNGAITKLKEMGVIETAAKCGCCGHPEHGREDDSKAMRICGVGDCRCPLFPNGG